MSDKEAVYPPCDFRLDGNGTRARCNSPAGVYCGCFVEPARCHLCLNSPSQAEEPTMPRPTRKLPTREKSASPGPASTSDTPPEPPGLVTRVFSYAEALARWTAAGRPERPDKEVERIFHQFCKTCRWFHRPRQVCRGCGCRVADNGYAIFNKIKMATERCPRNLW